MHNLPWKRIFTGVASGIALGAMFEPHLAAIQALIHGVEVAVQGQGAGAQKKTIVMAAGMALIQSELAGLTPEQQHAVQGALSAFIDAYVAAQNAYEALESAIVLARASVAALQTHV